MKKYILLLLTFFAILGGEAQNMKASIGLGSTARRIKIFMLPSAAGTASFSSLNFNVGIPSTFTPAPTLNLISHAFGGTVTWIIDPPYSEGGYWNYNIYNGQAGYTLPVTTAEFEAMELEFVPTGGPQTSVANFAHLVCLPDGGAGNNLALFYCTGNYTSNGQSLFYAHDGQTVFANGDSYTLVNPSGVRNGPLGTFISFARYTGSILIPVKFNGFTAVEKDDNGLLNWSVENESATTDRYEVERSLDGISFTKAYTVSPKNNGLSSNIYALTDFNLSLIKRSGVIYYRIKQVDKDGNFIYSEIRSVRLDGKGNAITIYPNPVKTTTVVNIDLVNAEKVSIVMYDVAGKEMQRSELQGNKGLNRYRLDMSNLPSGTYQVRVNTGTETTTLPVVKVN